MNIYINIKTWEDACKDQKKNPKGLPDYSKTGMSPAEIRFNLAVFKLCRILVSINKEKGKEWKPKPTDMRHYLWAWIKPDKTKRSGFRLSFSAVGYDFSIAAVASRLTCRDEARVKYVFEQFPELFEDILIFQNK